jgi:CTP synthase
LNNSYREKLTQGGMVLSGLSPKGGLVEVIEIKGHPWFIGCQFHPELKSRPTDCHPLFKGFIKASLVNHATQRDVPRIKVART